MSAKQKWEEMARAGAGIYVEDQQITVGVVLAGQANGQNWIATTDEKVHVFPGDLEVVHDKGIQVKAAGKVTHYMAPWQEWPGDLDQGQFPMMLAQAQDIFLNTKSGQNYLRAEIELKTA